MVERRLVMVCACLLFLPAAAALGQDGDPAQVTVKTLVIDALGTRTVDEDQALVPVGGRGLLVRQVLYGGPPVSYRLVVHVGPPVIEDDETQFPIHLVADVWRGTVEEAPGPSGRLRREEGGLVTEGSSYLLELMHDLDADRRILVSVTARPAPGEPDVDLAALLQQPDSLTPVDFYLRIERERGGVPEPPDTHLLTAMVGHPVTYASEVRAAPGTSGEPTGVSVTLEAEKARDGLVTVRVTLSGADYVDEQRLVRLPIEHSSVHTVRSGFPISVDVRLPGTEAGDPGTIPVVYRVHLTPSVKAGIVVN